MIDLSLRFWLGAGELEKLRQAAQGFWQQVETWVSWPSTQLDPLTCSVGMLNLLAWQRDIVRFAGEPLALYRNRVKFALVNAQDAGSVAGFVAIFERLGIGYVEVVERSDPVNWDVIILRLSDGQVAQNPDLLNRIIEQYGRTCRRYQLEVLTPLAVTVQARDTGNVWSLDVASL